MEAWKQAPMRGTSFIVTASFFNLKHDIKIYQNDKHAEYAEYSTYMLTLQPNNWLISASVLGMYFVKACCSKVENATMDHEIVQNP
jgi:hypothetical protein